MAPQPSGLTICTSIALSLRDLAHHAETVQARCLTRVVWVKRVQLKVWVGLLCSDYSDRCGEEIPGGQYRLYLPILANTTWPVRTSVVDGLAVHGARCRAIALPAHCQDFLVQVPPICPRIGWTLLTAVEDVARGAGRTLLVLDTRQGDAAEQLYMKQGYIRAGSIPQYARSADGTLHTTVFFYRVL